MTDELREALAELYAAGYLDGLKARRYPGLEHEIANGLCREQAVAYLLEMLPLEDERTEWGIVQRVIDATAEMGVTNG